MTVVTENYFGLFLELDYGISKMQFEKKKKNTNTKKNQPTPNALFNLTTAYTKNEKTKA